MNVRKMLLFDRWLGVPLCFVFTRLRWLIARAKRRDAKIERILFIKLAEQGSTVLAYPALREAVHRVGRQNVYMMVFDNNRFVLDALDVIPPENVIPLRHSNLFVLCCAAAAALLRLRRIGIDAVIDLEFFARSSALLAVMSGAWVRIGFHAYYGEGPYRGRLMTHRVRYNPHLHTATAFSILVQALDYSPAAFPTFPFKPVLDNGALPFFQADAKEIDDIRTLLQHSESGWRDASPLILLNANASDLIPLRRWPQERYVELSRHLLAEFPEVLIAFTGAPEEAGRSRELVRQVNDSRCFSLAGKTTLRQLLVLYTLADVLVTNDSGPAHFAALTAIHTVTLFGPETPALFASLNTSNIALWAGLACSPCVSALNNRQSACRDNVCMKSIMVGEVLDAVRVNLKRRSARVFAESV